MTYADNYNIRSPQHVKLNDIGDALDGLLVSYDTATATSTVNTTETTMQDLDGMSVTVTTAAGQIVFVIAMVDVSNGTTGKTTWLQLDEDGAAQSNSCPYYEPSGASTGVHGTVTLYYISKPAAGSHTYKVKFDTEASGTAYADNRSMAVMVFRNAAS